MDIKAYVSPTGYPVIICQAAADVTFSTNKGDLPVFRSIDNNDLLFVYLPETGLYHRLITE